MVVSDEDGENRYKIERETKEMREMKEMKMKIDMGMKDLDDDQE